MLRCRLSYLKAAKKNSYKYRMPIFSLHHPFFAPKNHKTSHTIPFPSAKITTFAHSKFKSKEVMKDL